MRILTFINSLGQSITFGGGSEYYITSLEGIDAPALNVFSQKAPFQDGSTYIDGLYDIRDINIQGGIAIAQDLSAIQTARRNMLSVLNPKLGTGTLAYQNNNTTYKTTAFVYADGKIFPNKNANDAVQTYSVVFECPDPYWYDVTQSSVLLQDTVANTTFPITFNPTIILSYYYGTTKIVNNTGDYTTPINIILYGPCTNPKIENLTTGEYIKITKTMVAGDLLEINTEFGNKTVYFTPIATGIKVSAMNLLNLGSTFWQLGIGNNSVQLSDDSSSTTDICTLYFSNRYIGA
jgi:Phage tail protein.